MEIYEVSYMWYAAIPCIWTIVVGTLVSFLTKPQDPKTLNPDLISPGFYQVFGGCWPKFINNYLIGLEIGSKWVIIFFKLLVNDEISHISLFRNKMFMLNLMF